MNWMSSERERLQEELEKEKRYNHGWIAHAEKISLQNQELFCELAAVKETDAALHYRTSQRQKASQSPSFGDRSPTAVTNSSDSSDGSDASTATGAASLTALPPLPDWAIQDKVNSPSMEGQERQCPDHEDGITGIRHDDPKDRGARVPTCQAFFIGDTHIEEVNSPSMQGQDMFEIEEEYESNWCEACVKAGEVTFADETFYQLASPAPEEELICLGQLPSELRSQISSYLDVPGLCAERATANETSSTKAFVAQLVQLVRPETPDVLVATADIFAPAENRGKIAELEQALARDNFHLFAGFQGGKCIFDKPLELCWARNPGAMTHLFECWIRHMSFSSCTEILLLSVADGVFDCLDWGALRVKQMFAAEVKRLDAESDQKRPSVQLAVSQLLIDFPEIRHLWPNKKKQQWHLPIPRRFRSEGVLQQFPWSSRSLRSLRCERRSDWSAEHPEDSTQRPVYGSFLITKVLRCRWGTEIGARSLVELQAFELVRRGALNWKCSRHIDVKERCCDIVVTLKMGWTF